MKRSISLWALLFLVCLSVLFAEVYYIDVTIKEIVDYPYDFHLKKVRIKGTITPDVLEKDSKYYFLTNESKNKIKVNITSKDSPLKGYQYIVSGTAFLDTNKDIFVVEDQREPLLENNSSSKGIDIILLGITAIALIVYIGYSIFRIITQAVRTIVTHSPSSEQIPFIPPQSVDDSQKKKIDGKIIRLTPQPDVTCKLLDGRFLTIKGDDVIREIRFFRPLNQKTVDFEFGRKETEEYTQIKLKTASVASKQASLKNSEYGDNYDGIYTLVNHAKHEATPTKLNGKPMAEGEEKPLSEGDKIELGVVVFIFTKED